jgi:hypothetical protein
MSRHFLLCLVLIVAGLVVGVGYGPALILQTQAVQSWQQVPATIDSVHVQRNSGGSGLNSSDSYEVVFAYYYQFNGQDYSGTRYQISRGFIHDTEKGALLAAESFRAQTEIQVYVNPDAPSEVVMFQGGLQFAWLTTLFGLAMLASGAFVYFTRVRVS